MAPRATPPGVTDRAEASSAARRVIVITLGWEPDPHPYRIAVNNVPLDHRMACRKQTGMSFKAFIGGTDSIDVDSVAVLVWMTRRLNGEPGLSFAQFARSWPDELQPGEIEIWAEDTQGRKVDEDNNPLPEELEPPADALDVDEVDDPQL